MPVAVRKYYSEEDFLIAERMSETKHEYCCGEVFDRARVPFEHVQITSLLIGAIGIHIQGKACNIFGSDLRVHTQLKSFYTYPDAVVICGEPSFVDNEFDTIINPSILFEILSPSTEEYDRTIKFEFYKSIPSLKQYVLIDSQKILIEVFTKQEDNSWHSEKKTNPEDEWTLGSINYKSKVKQVYEGVVFRKP